MTKHCERRNLLIDRISKFSTSGRIKPSGQDSEVKVNKPWLSSVFLIFVLLWFGQNQHRLGKLQNRKKSEFRRKKCQLIHFRFNCFMIFVLSFNISEMIFARNQSTCSFYWWTLARYCRDHIIFDRNQLCSSKVGRYYSLLCKERHTQIKEMALLRQISYPRSQPVKGSAQLTEVSIQTFEFD